MSRPEDAFELPPPPVTGRAIVATWLLPSRTMQRRAWPLAVGIGYVLLVTALGGVRFDHVFIGALALLDSWNEKSRLFLRAFFPFILTGVIYDGMRYFYWESIEGRVRVAEPYLRDKAWFGIDVFAGGTERRLTPNEYFQLHHWAAADLVCGFAYLVYVGEYLLTAFVLFALNRLWNVKLFGLGFLVVNLLGFITCFVYPVAPPWYVTRFGFGPARMHVPAFAAGAQRFDELLGTHFFDAIYGRGVDVYGAYPSLHVAYPLLVALGIRGIPELRRLRVPAAGFYLVMCFSAVYLQHHYVVDVLLGTLYASVTMLVLGRVLRREEPAR